MRGALVSALIWALTGDASAWGLNSARSTVVETGPGGEAAAGGVSQVRLTPPIDFGGAESPEQVLLIQPPVEYSAAERPLGQGPRLAQTEVALEAAAGSGQSTLSGDVHGGHGGALPAGEAGVETSNGQTPLPERLAAEQTEFDKAGKGGTDSQQSLIRKVYKEGGSSGDGGGPALVASGEEGGPTGFPNRFLPRSKALRLVGGTDLEREPGRLLGDKEGWAETVEVQAPGRPLVVKAFKSFLRPAVWLYEAVGRLVDGSYSAARNEAMGRFFLRLLFNEKLDTVDLVGYLGGRLSWIFPRPVVVMGKSKAAEDPLRLSILPLATRAAIGVFIQSRGMTDVNPRNVLLPKGSLFLHKVVVIDMERPVGPAGTDPVANMPHTSRHYWNFLDAHFRAEIERVRGEIRKRDVKRAVRRNMRKSNVRHPRNRDPIWNQITENVGRLETVFEENFLAANLSFMANAAQGGLKRTDAGILSAINRAAATDPRGGVFRDMVRLLLETYGEDEAPFWTGADKEPWVLHPRELARLLALVRRLSPAGLTRTDWEILRAGWAAGKLGAGFTEGELHALAVQLSEWIAHPPVLPELPPEIWRRAA